MRKILLTSTALLTLAGTLYLLTGRNAPPQPGLALPPVVPESLDSLLLSLEKEIAEHHPDLIPFLKPGVTDAELETAEDDLGLALNPNVQDLYRWHNGLEGDRELIPGHGYFSLEQAVEFNRAAAQLFLPSGLDSLMEREKNWLILFPDSAGDGYYYDPERPYQDGGVFYVFRESGYYRFFPSLKNLLKAVVEFYQNGLLPYDTQAEDVDLDAQIRLEEEMLDRYGVEVVK